MTIPTVVTRTAKGAPLDEWPCEFVEVLDIELAVHQVGKDWQCTEPETGFRFCGPAKSRDEAVIMARDEILKRGKEAVHKAIQHGLEMQK